MSDKKALTSSSDHGKFHIGDEDDYGVPSGSGHQKSAFFSNSNRHFPIISSRKGTTSSLNWPKSVYK